MEKVLIVEDDRESARVLENFVKIWGYEVCGTVRTGEEAIENAKAEKPDVILMDIGLAGVLDGIETAERIQQHIETAIIFITAKVVRSEQLKNVKPSILVKKPIVPNLLYNTIKRVLHHKIPVGFLAKNKQIILIEDNPISAKLEKKILENLGHEVIDVFSSMEEGIEKLNHIPADLVVSGIDLAGELDGIQGAHKIKEQFNIPVIFVSSRKKLEFQPFAHVNKQAFTAEDLQSAIERAMKGKV